MQRPSSLPRDGSRFSALAERRNSAVRRPLSAGNYTGPSPWQVRRLDQSGLTPQPGHPDFFPLARNCSSGWRLHRLPPQHRRASSLGAGCSCCVGPTRPSYRKRLTDCQEAVELARHAAETAPDPAWGGGPCAGLDSCRDRAFADAGRGSSASGRALVLVLERLTPPRQAQAVASSAGRTPEMLLELAQSLLRTLLPGNCANGWTSSIRGLLPKHAPLPDELAQRTFPRLAEDALVRATWLIRLERGHPLVLHRD